VHGEPVNRYVRPAWRIPCPKRVAATIGRHKRDTLRPYEVHLAAPHDGIENTAGRRRVVHERSPSFSLHIGLFAFMLILGGRIARAIRKVSIHDFLRESAYKGFPSDDRQTDRETRRDLNACNRTRY